MSDQSAEPSSSTLSSVSRALCLDSNGLLSESRSPQSLPASAIVELQQQAKGKGMVLVDSSGTAALFEEYVKVMAKADELCEVVDPESKPFESKYKARDLLDDMGKNLEATKAIATLESNKGLIDEIKPRQAALQLKTGVICWDCEEPHNAQTELEQACEFYYPGLIDKIEGLAGGDKDLNIHKREDGHINFEALLAAQEPQPASLPTSNLADGLKCLNILGILWSGRGQPGKAVCYLLTAKLLYEIWLSVHSHAALDPAAEHAYTHNLFYLAQAYGHLEDMQR
jgi:hypothetical protein